MTKDTHVTEDARNCNPMEQTSRFLGWTQRSCRAVILCFV